jgi:ketosteroid isomerase-like protein
MSKENQELILRAVDAVNRADADAWVACYHPDVQFEVSGDSFPGFGGIYRGRAGVRRWFEEALELWDSVHIELEETTESGDDRVVVGVLMTTRGTESGVETKLRLWQAFWVLDGLVVRRRGPYWVRDEALAAVGLPDER